MTDQPSDRKKSERRCQICGAPPLHTNPNMCKNYHQIPHQEPAEQRYIISESQLNQISTLYTKDWLGLYYDEIRANPHTPCPHLGIEHSDGVEYVCSLPDTQTEKKSGYYIITDDMLAAWRLGCIQWRDKNPNMSCNGCDFKGKGARKNCCEFDDDEMKKIFQSHPCTSTVSERYTGRCAIQDKCNDYSDFIESIEDELNEDDEDPVCPIKCAQRVNLYPTTSDKRIADVIEKLEALKRLAIENHDNSGNNSNYISRYVGKREAYDIAITLLKEVCRHDS
ncbi:MAG: hypothetical protein PHC39_04955 [Proteiniphilum sp.]|nr:hypothetical protein [Proteiniphilum sp.]